MMSRSIIKRIFTLLLDKPIKQPELLTDWQSKEAPVGKDKFGEGNTKDWEWYFSGKSSVDIKSIEDICNWLEQCEYILDSELFKEDDFWQHPITLEHTRKGDCEDQSLWAWRKLASIGINADFVVGWTDDNGVLEGHAWLVFEYGGIEYIFESTGESKEDMMLEFDEYYSEYTPEFSVDIDFRTYVYKQGLAYLEMQ